MSEQSAKPHSLRLTVLPNSGKVEQLRAEAAQAQSAESPAPSSDSVPRWTPAPNPSTPTYTGHANRIAPNPAAKTIEYKLLEGKIIAALRSIYDPEIPVDIYELGLIYDIIIDESKNVHLRMTLTAPGCPVAGTLPPEVGRKVEEIEGVNEVTVELVWEPGWTKDMMSEAAMLQLGLC